MGAHQQSRSIRCYSREAVRRAAHNSGIIVMKDMSSNRLQALLSKVKKLLQNKYFWRLLFLILRLYTVLKLWKEGSELDE